MECWMTETTNFASGDGRCAAWVTLPDRPPPHPVVVLVHGGGAVHDMKLPEYEVAFSGAGLAVVSFDYRHFGSSSGEPRQLFSVRRQLVDVDAALAFVAARPDLERDRVALWGTSLGASHVLTTAARRSIAAAVIQCPIVRGRAPALASGWRNLARLSAPIASDLLRATFRRPRCYVPIVGRPGERGFVTAPGAFEGWRAVVGEPTTFENRVAAASGLGMLPYDPSRAASRIRCPLLVCVSDNEELMDASLAARVAHRAPEGEAFHYPADHFEVYAPPLFDRMVGDQIAFIQRTLRVDASQHGRSVA
jgi:fermentation-respiration switch protein FrsA (DUF1100 family)